MKTNKTRVNQGYMTVYLALTMTILLSLYLALIEGARSNAIRLEAECITDIGLNSVLAEYHRELYKQYNLFAIDTSYGSFRSGTDKLETHLREYLERNMSNEDIFLGNLFYKDFLAMSLDELDVTKVSCLTDGKGAVFRKRAVEVIKDDVGISLMKDLAEWTQTVTNHQLNERDIAAEKKKVDEEIMERDGDEIEIFEDEWVTIEIDNPTDGLEEIRKAGILSRVVQEEGQLSAKGISTELLVGTRMEEGKINQGNWEIQELSAGEQLTERFFFQEYLIKYMGRYGRQDEGNALEYQLEYLVSGKNSDIQNLQQTMNMLCAMREVANVVYLFSDEEKCMVAELLAAVLATLMLVPEITDLLKVTLLFGWAYAESIYDVEVLLKGGRIPLIKDDTTWHYSLENALLLNSESEETVTGLSYEDYLRIFMSFTDINTLTSRAMNMVEADIRETPGNEAFRLDACYDCIEVDISIKSAYGYEYEITRQKNINRKEVNSDVSFMDG